MKAHIGIVAVNTFREAIRDRILYNLIFFALLMMLAALLVGQISIGIERLVIVNLGLSAIATFGLVMAVLIGVGLVYKEIDKRTLYAVLSKPLRRWEFLVGKYSGLLLTLGINTLFMALGLALTLLYVDRGMARADGYILLAIYFIFLQLALVTALALLFSCFSTPALSALFTVGVYVAGMFAPDLRALGPLAGNRFFLGVLSAGLYYLLPNFNNFNIISAAAHQRSIPPGLLLQNTAYALVYIALLLMLGAVIFSRRDLK